MEQQKGNCPCGQQCCQREFGYVKREDFLAAISSIINKPDGVFKQWEKEIAESAAELKASHGISE